MRPPKPAELARQVATFNARFPVRAEVAVRMDDGTGRLTTARSPAQAHKQESVHTMEIAFQDRASAGHRPKTEHFPPNWLRNSELRTERVIAPNSERVSNRRRCRSIFALSYRRLRRSRRQRWGSRSLPLPAARGG